MTIEEKALKLWGATDIPEFTTWMTKDGILINGSYYNRQRDVDHREISQFYTRSKNQQPGDYSIYMYKFMRRGNICIGCTRDCCCIMELWQPPTDEQIRHMIEIFKEYEHLECGIRVHTRTAIKTYTFHMYLHKLESQGKLPAYAYDLL